MRGIHFRNSLVIFKVITIPTEVKARKQTTDEMIMIGRRPAFSIIKEHTNVLSDLTAPINRVHRKGSKSTPDNRNK